MAGDASLVSHKITRLRYGDKPPYLHGGRCKCGGFSGKVEHEWAVDDWWRVHLSYVEKVKAYLGTRTPTLTAQRDYYRLMSEDQSVPEKERDLWKQLAEELDHRVNDGPEKSEQVPLF